MYTISNRLKIVSLILIIVGGAFWGTSYVSSHVTVEDVKVMLAEEEASHGGGHEAEATDHAPADTHGEATADHGDEHAEHVMHQIHNM